jgi:NAD(P)-dependent dehydrogenase (short-subunit alcohol dehydrogenase family)
MKILIIGANGTIGSAIYEELKNDTEIVTASLNHGDYRVDMGSVESIKKLFTQIGQLDAIVCAASRGVVLKPLAEMTREDYLASIQQKLLGQISLVLEGAKVLNDKGSFSLITGIMNHDFVKDGTAAAMVNNAVEGFAKAAALDLPRGLRINVISPALLEDSVEKYKDYCPGFEPVSREKVARAFRKSVYGIHTGRVYHIS